MAPRTKTKGFISGGGDGLIIIWNANFVQEKTYDIKLPEIKSLIPKVRSVWEHKSNEKILVGTRGGEIMEFGSDQKKPVIHMRSHCDGELWGLTPHPSKAEFITIGQDNMLAIWDVH